MEEYNKTYGFTINVYDDPKSVRSLWPVTQSFLDANPQYLSRDNSLLWLTDRKRRPGRYDEANGYSTCHFWSNFEIGDLDFWRSEAYEQFFEHLDRTGGFFYERWGDAPVHSVALGLFLDNEKIHWSVPSFDHTKERFRTHVVSIFNTLGSEILDTSIRHILIVRISPAVRPVSLICSRTVGLIMKIVALCGSIKYARAGEEKDSMMRECV